MPHATVLRQMPPDTRRAGVGGWEELGGRRRRCCGGRRRRLAGYSTGRVRSTQQYRYTDSTGVVTWAGCARPPPAQRTHISFIALLNSCFGAENIHKDSMDRSEVVGAVKSYPHTHQLWRLYGPGLACKKGPFYMESTRKGGYSPSSDLVDAVA